MRETKRLFGLGGLLMALALGPSTTQAQNLVQNPGFDLNATAGSGSPLFWSVSPGNNFYDNNQATTGAGFGPLSSPFSAQFSSQIGPDTLLQSLITVPGQSYTFSFWVNADPNSYMTVDWGSTPVYAIDDTSASFLNDGLTGAALAADPNHGWQLETFTETATGLTTKISFAGGTEGGVNNTGPNADPNVDPGWFGIDNVSVVTNNAVAGVPDGGATLGLLGGAIIGLAAFRRRFGSLRPSVISAR